jgi:molybdate/tungstate transport system substrate-binding protein
MRKISEKGLIKIQSVIIGAVIAVALAGGFWYYWSANTGKVVLKVFCAGSLTLPLEEIKSKFETDHANVEVQVEPSGSVAAVQKITESDKLADVLASADFTLIPSMMMPDYADWCIRFAKNRMVLAYTDNSRYADEINSTNWYEILQRTDVKWAFSNPNMDPCGYRAPMVIQLAELEYGDNMIFDNLVVNNSAITATEEDGVYQITTPEELNPDTTRLKIRDKSVELVSMLQEGGIDYAWEYMSVAKQHDLNYLELPETIDLSTVTYTETYKKVEVQTTSENIVGKPIVYGVTVPTNALNRELGEQFVIYMINEYGQNVFLDMGQPPIVPAKTENMDNIPESLRTYVTE